MHSLHLIFLINFGVEKYSQHLYTTPFFQKHFDRNFTLSRDICFDKDRLLKTVTRFNKMKISQI